jgi:hypothetical protein
MVILPRRNSKLTHNNFKDLNHQGFQITGVSQGPEQDRVNPRYALVFPILLNGPVSIKGKRSVSQRKVVVQDSKDMVICFLAPLFKALGSFIFPIISLTFEGVTIIALTVWWMTALS